MNLPFRFLLLCGLSLLLSCDSGDWLVEQNFGEAMAWAVDEPLAFSYENQTSVDKALQLELTFSADYPYQNIWFKLDVTDPEGQQSEIIFGDTLMEVGGEWIGQQDVGTSLDWTIEPQPLINLSSIGTYQFKLSQHMREEQLAGIQNVKLALP